MCPVDPFVGVGGRHDFDAAYWWFCHSAMVYLDLDGRWKRYNGALTGVDVVEEI